MINRNPLTKCEFNRLIFDSLTAFLSFFILPKFFFDGWDFPCISIRLWITSSKEEVQVFELLLFEFVYYIISCLQFHLSKSSFQNEGCEKHTHTPPNISTRSIWVCFCVRRREKIDSNLPKIEKWWVDGAMQPNYKLLQPIRSVSFLSFFDFLLLSSVRFSSPCVWCVVRYIGCYFLHIFRHLFMWLSLFVSCWRLSDLIRRNHS